MSLSWKGNRWLHKLGLKEQDTFVSKQPFTKIEGGEIHSTYPKDVQIYEKFRRNAKLPAPSRPMNRNWSVLHSAFGF
jgi:hypothetical protein